MNRNVSTKTITRIGILSAIATVIMYIEFVIPGFLVFLKLDFSDIPALIGAFAFGPLAGILIGFIKNVIHVFSTSTGGVGELANFIVSSAFAGTAGLVYKINKNKKGAIIALLIGSIAMIIIAALSNYFILLPLYSKAFGWEAILAMSQETVNKIEDMVTLIVYGIIPFNILKTIVISISTFFVYKKISPILHK